MDIKVFPLSEIPTALGALQAIHPEPNEAQRHFIEIVGRLHGVLVDCDLPTPTPKRTARIIADPHRRKRLVELAVVTATIDGEVDGREAAAITELADALGVDDRAVHTIRELSRRHHLMARLDMTRRLLGRFAGEAWRDGGFSSVSNLVSRVVSDGTEDPALAWRYKSLGLMPAGSFGRVFWEHMVSRRFGFPGERGGLPERMVFHDLGHVLAGYDTDPDGEIQQAAFQSGFMRNDGFAFLFFGIIQFHLGLKLTPVAVPEHGYFDVDKVMTALARGAACKVDLGDHWDFWPLMSRPLDEVRAELGITPLLRQAARVVGVNAA